jgi:hypothetical protein
MLLLLLFTISAFSTSESVAFPDHGSGGGFDCFEVVAPVL